MAQYGACNLFPLRPARTSAAAPSFLLWRLVWWGPGRQGQSECKSEQQPIEPHLEQYSPVNVESSRRRWICIWEHVVGHLDLLSVGHTVFLYFWELAVILISFTTIHLTPLNFRCYSPLWSFCFSNICFLFSLCLFSPPALCLTICFFLLLSSFSPS